MIKNYCRLALQLTNALKRWSKTSSITDFHLLKEEVMWSWFQHCWSRALESSKSELAFSFRLEQNSKKMLDHDNVFFSLCSTLLLETTKMPTNRPSRGNAISLSGQYYHCSAAASTAESFALIITRFLLGTGRARAVESNGPYFSHLYFCFPLMAIRLQCLTSMLRTWRPPLPLS